MLTYLYSKFTPYEWILTNKKGGYALGTAFLTNIRKYHGLLIAGKEKGYREHLVATLEEKVIFLSGLEYYLDSNFYLDTVYPEGYKLIKDFFFRPYPSFTFYCPKSEENFLQKNLYFSKDKNAILLEYKNLSTYPFRLYLRPKLTFRNHHHVTNASSWRDYQIEEGERELLISKDASILFTYFSEGKVQVDPIFYYRVYYPLEELRGYPALEDLFSPFLLEIELSPTETLYLLFSDMPIKDFEKEVEAIKSYYRNSSLKISKEGFSDKDFFPLLKNMLKDFLIEKNIIAGYPWFYCWGRDTFIGLPALFYLEDGLEICYKIFENYKGLMKKGLIPNVIGSEEETNYNSLDGTLWFGLRILEYLEFFGEKVSEDKKRNLLQAVKEIIETFITESSLPFYYDEEDGLLCIPEESNLALTWMDVMIDGNPLTPRYEKPIEISFLWHNLLKLASTYLEKSFLNSFKIRKILERQKETLKKYFGEDSVADRLYKGMPIFETRPNFVIALSLPYPKFSKELYLKAERIVRDELLTPYGLRTLSPKHPAFKRKYFGNQYQRDLAYHNGTVWVWLLYPYAKFLKKFLAKRTYKEELKKLLHPFKELILSGKVGSLPELYDGDHPYFPKGAPSQFWSVAAIFLLEAERLGLKGGLK
ncbi:MAG: hypothetical protein C0197_06655 [Caldimicrobium thiodismutans]|uniref:Glycogen debranching protein n=1 Tax=Caldimicrobium thiodismutans TaxID=1653476 RepID=A0A2N7PHX0_9BACT|nr:MAG: hypothetical protein C0197_06655 [Caldimicrobium thiodismutans]